MFNSLGDLQGIRDMAQEIAKAERECREAEKTKFLEKLRDQFAASAMQKCLEEVQMIAGSKLTETDYKWTQCNPDVVADMAYKMADAMMRRRLSHDPCVPCEDPCGPSCEFPSDINISSGGVEVDINKSEWHRGPLPPCNGELVIVKFSEVGDPVIVRAYTDHVRVLTTNAERTSSSVHSWCELPD